MICLSLLKALHFIIDEGCYLFFEGGNPIKELAKFIEQNKVREQENIARETLWPKQSAVHLPLNKSLIDRLAAFANNASRFEFGVHLHIYKKGQAILDWHDAFAQETLLTKELPEKFINAFAVELGVDFKYETELNQ